MLKKSVAQVETENTTKSKEVRNEMNCGRNEFFNSLLDVNLGGVVAYAVADLLVARKSRSLPLSGYENKELKARYPNVGNCLKPYLFPQMEGVLASALSG